MSAFSQMERQRTQMQLLIGGDRICSMVYAES